MDPNSWTDAVQVAVIANILSAAILLLAGVALYELGRRLGRRNLDRFFGIRSRKTGAVQIRLSNLQVKGGGTRGVTPITEGFVGAAITEGEYAAASDLALLLEDGPRRGFAGWLVKLAAQQKAESSRICRIWESPETTGEPRREFPPDGVATSGHALPTAEQRHSVSDLFGSSDVVILVGAPIYNSLTDHVSRHPLARGGTHFRFVRLPPVPADVTGRSIRGITFMHSGEPPGKPYLRESVIGPLPRGDGVPTTLSREYFIVEKQILDRPNADPVTLFVCAGTGTTATVHAVSKLLAWKDLRAAFGNGAFSALFQVDTDDPEWKVKPPMRRYDEPRPHPVERYPSDLRSMP
jgi:hypothetical protein